MAQIIKHRRGSLEALSAVTSSLSKGEIIIASGSTNLSSVSNGKSLVFAVPENGQVQAVNRFLIAGSDPSTFASSTYNGMLDGVPYYNSGSGTLFLLSGSSNYAISLIGNIQPFSTSVNSRLATVEASIGGGGAIGSRVSALEVFSGSQETKNSTLATYTASVNSRLDLLSNDSGSQAGRLSNLESFSGSQNTKNADLATYTGSINTKWNTLENVTASILLFTASNGNTSLNSYTASTNTTHSLQLARLSRLEESTASLNTFTQSLNTALTVTGTNVSIVGNLTVGGTQTIVNSTTVQLGDNIIELNGTGTANGGIYVKDPTIPNLATGSLIWDSTTDQWKAGVKDSEIKILLVGGDNVVSGSSQINFTGLSGISANIISASTDTANVDMIITGGSISANLYGGVVSGSSQITAGSTTNFATDVKTQLNSNTVVSGSSQVNFTQLSGISANIISASTDSNNIDFTISGGSITANLFGGVVSGSAQVVGMLTSLNTYTGSNDTTHSLQNARLSRIEESTASLNTFSASQNTKNETLRLYTASIDTKFTTLATYTGSNDTTNTTQNTRLSRLEESTASLNTFTHSANSRLTTLEGAGTIQGVGTTNNVTFGSLTTTNNVTVGGDLVVQGNTVTLNTSTLIVEDKTIQIASGSANAAAANGAGIEVVGASATFTYDATPNAWTANIPISASAVTASVNVPGFGASKRITFRATSGNLDFITAPTTAGDLVQWDGTNFTMSNVIDGGSF